MRWLEFSKDYDINLKYHPGKANVVADTLSCQPYPALNYVVTLPSELCDEFQSMELNAITLRVKPMLYSIKAQTHLDEEICVAQAMDLQLEQMREEV